MEKMNELLLTIEQTEELVSGLNPESSIEENGSKSIFGKVKQNLKNGITGLFRKTGKEVETQAALVTESVTLVVNEPAKEIEAAKSEMKDTQGNAPKKMTNYEYRCYLNSVVFGE